MDDKLTISIQAARAAGKIQLEKYRQTFQIREKGPANLVTEVDISSERVILEVLRSGFPDIPALTEEDPDPSDRRESTRWMIDPLDGTTNFAHGHPFFGTSIAFQHNGQVVHGVVYLPVFDELFTASKGKGAFLNGKQIHVSSTPSLDQALLSSGFPYDAWTNGRNNTREFSNLVKKVVSMRSGGAAAVDLCFVALGILDGYWELDLEPWDMAAGALIVEEAGGQVSLVNGRSFDLYSRSILASNRILHPMIVDELARP
jgi:myo-inositol-1(or 4)-monophosphatase